MLCYKATTQEMKTGILWGIPTQWEIGITQTKTGPRRDPYTSDFLYAYTTISASVILDTMGYMCDGGRLFEAEAQGDCIIERGVIQARNMTLLREINPPLIDRFTLMEAIIKKYEIKHPDAEWCFFPALPTRILEEVIQDVH